MSNVIDLRYSPRDVFRDFHSRNERWSCIVAHRRCGKTVACINDLHERALYTGKKNARYAYIAPFYSQAKNIAWDYLKDATQDTAVKVRESDLSVELFNGAKITLYGADNPDSFRGLYFDGVILDEYGDCRPSLWGEVILPTLADRKGWAVFIGTPKGRNHFYQIYQRSITEKGWYNSTLKASTTNIIDIDELREMRSQMTENEFEQEFECSFEAAVMGTYYAGILANMEERLHLKNLYDADHPVFAACDLGYSDSSAWWFYQPRRDGFAIIDYEEANGEALEYYFDMLDAKPYEIEKIWLPHDAKARTLQTGRSTIEQFFVRGYEHNEVGIVPRLKVQQGIDAVRMFLQACYFDEKCDDGVEGLRAYQRRYNEVTKSFAEVPMHNWASHPADGFRSVALVGKERTMSQQERTLRALTAPKGYNLNDLFSDNERKGKSGKRGIYG